MPVSIDQNKVNILIVDDLPEKILVMETVLAELDQNLITARSGEEALRRVLEHDFAVILLDINMPGMDGLETAAYIRRRKRSAHTPIIFITAYADEVHTAQGYSLGAVDHIFAPVVPNILRSKVKVFVDLFRLNQQTRRQADERVALAREQAARTVAEEATRRFHFLADASTRLSSSLDVAATLRDLAQLVVPFVADLAAVTRIDEQGRVGQTELVWAGGRTHTFEKSEDLPESLKSVVGRELVPGRTELLSTFAPWPTPGQNETSAVRADFSVSSAAALPLVARGRILGILTIALGPSGRSFSATDLTLAEDLAARAAIALDNARLYQNIQEGDRRKNEFLAMLSHELRNPLGPIRNSVQVLQLLGPSEPTLRRAQEMIARQVTHMARLIDDLLDMSRLSRGKILLRGEAVDLTSIVRDTAEDYRNLFESSNVKLGLTLPEGPLPVFGDPTRLSQVVGNVLNNANKFTETGGEVFVELKAEPDGRFASLVIRDTGIGMEPEILERVFDMFSQADSSLDRSRGGLGLGLALVKGLVDLHGGEVYAKSEGLGHGTSVIIRLPLMQSAQELRTPIVASDAIASACRVLVIEDNPDAAESIRILFHLHGHDVRVEYAGYAGVEAARTFCPEIVLCDIGLPGGMDGYAVARTLKQEPGLRGTRLIALSGYGQDEDQRRSREAGFDAHMIKPVDFNELQRVLAKLSEPV